MKKKVKQQTYTLQGYYLFAFFAMGSLYPFLSLYFSEVEGLNGYQIGTILSIGPVIMIFFQPLWGMLCDITQKPRLILTFTTVLAGLFGLTYLLFDNYYVFIAIAVLVAVFQSSVIPVSDSISLQFSTREKLNYGNIRLFGSIGFGLAVFIIGRLSETDLGLSVIFYAFSAAFIISSVLSLRMPNENSKARGNIFSGIKEIFRLRKFVIFLAITFLIFGPNLANNVYFGLFIEDRGGTYTGIGIAFLVAVLSEIPFMQVAGRMIDRIGIMNVVVLASAVSLVRWIFYFTQPSLEIVYVSAVLQGFSIGLFIPAGLRYVREIMPDHITVTAVTMYSAIGNGLGNWFSTFVSGVIYESFHIYAVYFFFAVLAGAGLILSIWMAAADKKMKKPAATVKLG
ncbi:MFS transporter [Peribacillus saganii]|uniref:MFS transporter n=1 Tax=Peribacillus saganii TaxID=2303992 RepID=A0A372LJ06_9BACI|nr:MFS transporter [Peribacillus saganii]RFU66362.1 MFS transporter [Peribacillus saganii]